MSKKPLIVVFVILGFSLLLGLLIVYLQQHHLAVLQPAGKIAREQRDLLVIATFLSLIVIIPVFILTFFIAWKYRASNTKATYRPSWDHSRTLETLWWGIPCAIIFILSIITWQSSHSLDPFKALEGEYKPVTVQVVALQWKWLFIYPEQKIATVNYVQFPEKTPINFQITADAPMNSFWIPRLGGQVYAMAGMSTHLHLMADKPGTYRGSSANLSGKGFADMQFDARSMTQGDFYSWVQGVRKSSRSLTSGSYRLLATLPDQPLPLQYVVSEPGIYDSVIEKYMNPNPRPLTGTTEPTSGHGGMH